MRLTTRIVLLSLLLVLFSVVLIGCGGSSADENKTVTAPAPAASAPAATPTVQSPSPAGKVISIVNRDVAGSGEYKFDPNELTFSMGETVTFSITAETEFHTFTVDDLGIDESIDAGETVELTFTFDTTGTFKLYCIPHEAQGMVGTITVEAPSY